MKGMKSMKTDKEIGVENAPLLGKKLVLHTVSFPEMEKEEEDQFFEVEIVEAKLVNNTWGAGESFGYRAIDKEGKEFFCNWNCFPDDSMTPMWSWDDRKKMFYDITYIRNCPKKPKFIDQFESIEWCEIHKRIYVVDKRFGCFDCFTEEQHPEVKQKREAEQTWKGWF